MHCDSAFYIGRTHDICEDYVTTYSENGSNHVVLCDGCSSSEMVDVGARLLALAYSKILDISDTVTVKSFATQFYEDNFFRFIKQNPTMFDCTTLSIRVKNDNIFINIIGDGLCVIKQKDGLIVVHDFTEGNMPFYLSYRWDNSRLNSYKSFNIKNIMNKYVDGKFIDADQREMNDDEIITIYKNIDDVEWVAILSDGVHSFKDKDGNIVDFMEVLKELLNFKTYTGRFAQRRLNAFRKKCSQLGWTHDDDISLGVMYLGE